MTTVESYKIARTLAHVVGYFPKTVPNRLNDYSKVEKVFSRYNLNEVCRRSGHIYNSLFNAFKRCEVDLPGKEKFEELTIAEVVHFSVIIICDLNNHECLPIWPVHNFCNLNGEELSTVLSKNADWHKTLERQTKRLVSNLKKAFGRNIKTRQESKDIISGLNTDICQLQQYSHDLAACLKNATTVSSSVPELEIKCKIEKRVKEVLEQLPEMKTELRQLQDKYNSFFK